MKFESQTIHSILSGVMWTSTFYLAFHKFLHLDFVYTTNATYTETPSSIPAMTFIEGPQFDDVADH